MGTQSIWGEEVGGQQTGKDPLWPEPEVLPSFKDQDNFWENRWGTLESRSLSSVTPHQLPPTVSQ